MAKKETTKKAASKKKAATKKKEEPVVITQSEPEPVPTVEDAEKALENAFDIMNGDPAVVSPVEEEAPVEVEEAAPVEEIKAEEPAEEEPIPEAKKTVHHTENKPKRNIVSRVFGYLWNGQEMDI
jgi:hypothetical protein